MDEDGLLLAVDMLDGQEEERRGEGRLENGRRE
jgi:hypothetical protein